MERVFCARESWVKDSVERVFGGGELVFFSGGRSVGWGIRAGTVDANRVFEEGFRHYSTIFTLMSVGVTVWVVVPDAKSERRSRFDRNWLFISLPCRERKVF
jgi:hypothetical protein